MLKHLYIPFAALALAMTTACTSDTFVGADVLPVPGDETGVAEESAIVIDGIDSHAMTGTRAAGSQAAGLLGGTFRVFATNGSGVVFNNYVVKWTDNPGTSPTNVHGWEYQGYMSKSTSPVLQYLKFWDESLPRYDFVAFAGLDDGQQIESVSANTYTIDATNMYRLYYANRVSAAPVHRDAVENVSPEFIAYKTPVRFTFQRATARIRVGFYETIPGYAVKDVRFYYDDNSDAPAGTSEKTTVALDGAYPVSGDYTITYDANNDIVTTFNDGGSTASYRELGTLAYTTAESTGPANTYLTADGSIVSEGEMAFLGTSSSTASYARSSENIDGVTNPLSVWHPVLPYESNVEGLRLKVDYTLVAIDGTRDVIRVRGAQAQVPANYCRWRPNYSYTYLFKINDRAGHTGDDTSPEGLYPITFDAETSSIVLGDDFHEEILED